MSKGKGRVIVGMSGGVDSAVAAYLLKEEGYECIGVTIRSWDEDENRCCEIDEARRCAFKLSIPFYPINALESFRENVVNPFIDDYLQGRTPNPCVLCNRSVKWEKLLHIANIKNTDFVATGHYASIKRINNRYAVGMAKDTSKDQSYMLYRLTQEDLSRTIFPLADFTKTQARNIAKDIGLEVYNKPDSQEICFVKDNDYADFLQQERKSEISGEGYFLDDKGNVLGKHKGVIYYTVGQRKGLGLALGYPAYVKKISADKNEIIIGREEDLYTDEIMCKDLNFMGIAPLKDGETATAKVKIRYQHQGEYAIITKTGNNAKIKFKSPVRAAAPGQSAVFYNNEGFVLGGGIIV